MAVSRNNPVVNKYEQLYQSIGRTALHYLYPNDFEVYMCSLEVTDAEGEPIDFFTFPISPSSIKVGEPSNVSLTKSAGGISIVSSPTFSPLHITLNGNFGRKFKLLVGRESVTGAGFNFSRDKGLEANQILKATFSPTVKSGYGCMKILQNIVRLSKRVDDEGRPYRLYFYNPAMGESFLVKVNNFDIETNAGQLNMMHGYSLQLIAIAPIEATNGADRGSLLKTLTYQNLNAGLKLASTEMRNQLNNLIY